MAGELVERAIGLGYLSDGETVSITVTSSDADWQAREEQEPGSSGGAVWGGHRDPDRSAPEEEPANQVVIPVAPEPEPEPVPDTPPKRPVDDDDRWEDDRDDDDDWYGDPAGSDYPDDDDDRDDDWDDDESDWDDNDDDDDGDGDDDDDGDRQAARCTRAPLPRSSSCVW